MVEVRSIYAQAVIDAVKDWGLTLIREGDAGHHLFAAGCKDTRKRKGCFSAAGWGIKELSYWGTNDFVFNALSERFDVDTGEPMSAPCPTMTMTRDGKEWPWDPEARCWRPELKTCDLVSDGLLPDITVTMPAYISEEVMAKAMSTLKEDLNRVLQSMPVSKSVASIFDIDGVCQLCGGTGVIPGTYAPCECATKPTPVKFVKVDPAICKLSYYGIDCTGCVGHPYGAKVGKVGP